VPAKDSLNNFRVVQLRATVDGETIFFTADEATALGVKAGDAVRAVPLSVRERNPMQMRRSAARA
jgi:arginine/ornithine N-succinyltransferase beta subunit